jgi:hypothetical protein
VLSQDDRREGIAAMAPYHVFVGWDPREAAAFAVARSSLIRHASEPIEVHGLVLSILQERAFYWRPLKYKTTLSGHTMMWDMISGAPMATQFACSRFLVKELAREGWAIFCDSDFLFRADICQLFRSLSDEYAVQCVKHEHNPDEIQKMDGQVQTRYARKNWSSLYAVNCNHPANDALTLDMVNTLPGRELHRFCWLDDGDIGDLDPAWNHLVSVNAPRVDAKGVHFTLGTPDMAGYEDCEYAEAWREELERWAFGK